MSLFTFLEKVVVGNKAVENRKRVETNLSAERERLEKSQNELRADIRQNQQLVSSGSRVLRNMTHAMILVEADSGKPKK